MHGTIRRRRGQGHTAGIWRVLTGRAHESRRRCGARGLGSALRRCETGDSFCSSASVGDLLGCAGLARCGRGSAVRASCGTENKGKKVRAWPKEKRRRGVPWAHGAPSRGRVTCCRMALRRTSGAKPRGGSGLTRPAAHSPSSSGRVGGGLGPRISPIRSSWPRDCSQLPSVTWAGKEGSGHGQQQGIVAEAAGRQARVYTAQLACGVPASRTLHASTLHAGKSPNPRAPLQPPLSQPPPIPGISAAPPPLPPPAPMTLAATQKKSRWHATPHRLHPSPTSAAHSSKAIALPPPLHPGPHLTHPPT